MLDKHLIAGDIDISSLINVRNLLSENINRTGSDIERAGLIQFFEMGYELSWKTLKKVLAQHKGINETTPRDVFREAARAKLINDPEIWFDFIAKRNETAHTYNEAKAQIVIDKIDDFLIELNKLIGKLDELNA